MILYIILIVVSVSTLGLITAVGFAVRHLNNKSKIPAHRTVHKEILLTELFVISTQIDLPKSLKTTALCLQYLTYRRQYYNPRQGDHTHFATIHENFKYEEKWKA